MATEPSNVKFEIGHVWFIDIVGYSKLLITDQSERLQRLKEIVWGTEHFPAGSSRRQLFPVWDPLRGDPRFEQIVASLAKKTASSTMLFDEKEPRST
jgi:hypothetical protein